MNLAICAFISSRKIKESERKDWLADAKVLNNFSKLGHVVMVPTYQEPRTKIKETIEKPDKLIEYSESKSYYYKHYKYLKSRPILEIV